jgi:hypothetical protein
LRYERQPELVYASLDMKTQGMDLPMKRWRVAEAVAASVGRTREAKP